MHSYGMQWFVTLVSNTPHQAIRHAHVPSGGVERTILINALVVDEKGLLPLPTSVFSHDLV
jgi:hypothetical protein